jgi:hypothetical protein
VTVGGPRDGLDDDLGDLSDDLSDDLGPITAAIDDGTESCLCLVAGYAKQDGLIARVTAEAEQRVSMSPMLGDFLQLRFVDLGQQPGLAGDRFRPVRRIATELMAARESAGRSHFALIVIAKSAMTIEGLLGTCAAEPFLAGLRVRYAGIASTDDRQPGTGFADIVSSSTGKWGGRDLVDALRRQCDELPRFFTTRGDPGLTRAELTALRQVQDAGGDVGRAPEDGDEGSEDGESDILDDADPPAGMPFAAGAVPGNVSDADADAARGAGARHPLGVSRWLPGIRWRAGRQPAAADRPGPAPTTTGLVYLLAVGEPDAMDDPALGSLQTALAELDKGLAAQQACAYRVRLLHGEDGELRGKLLDAGLLGRRAAKRSVTAGDFSELLKGVRASLRRDGAQLEVVARSEGQTVARPAVVIFTTDPPLADRSSATAFADLAAEAAVVWVVPANSQGLVSPTFANAPTVAVIGEHQGIADEICELLSAAGAYSRP